MGTKKEKVTEEKSCRIINYEGVTLTKKAYKLVKKVNAMKELFGVGICKFQIDNDSEKQISTIESLVELISHYDDYRVVAHNLYETLQITSQNDLLCNGHIGLYVLIAGV